MPIADIRRNPAAIMSEPERLPGANTLLRGCARAAADLGPDRGDLGLQLVVFNPGGSFCQRGRRFSNGRPVPCHDGVAQCPRRGSGRIGSGCNLVNAGLDGLGGCDDFRIQGPAEFRQLRADTDQNRADCQETPARRLASLRFV